MCGRYTLFASMDDIVERFMVDVFEEGIYEPSYNIAPSHQVVAIINDGRRNRLGRLRWGLIPPWAKDEKMGYKTINARGETVANKPSFRNAYRKKRCILPADSFYEWQHDGKNKTPINIKMKDGGLFGLAGLWESWKSPDGNLIHSCTVVTTEANEIMEQIHDRMPVILKPESEKIWLSPSIQDPEVLNRLIRPFDAEQMETFIVSNEVNSPKSNHEGLIIPVC
ncbi:SOS response-associated peptidase [Chungangia koreensis]|uniref:Abasic site processing protein n=1 Tax=Chungangia koreensis TaxID=752657 RepID=A0ABV8X314_9LACT